MRDIRIWRQELVDEIRTISDPAQLERLWSGADPKAISSYSEEVNHVFGDYDIDGFLAAGPEQTALTPLQLAALRRFRDEFSRYVDANHLNRSTEPDYRAVLADPRWGRITKLARDFIALVDGARHRG